jgi:hypothetical protein
MNTKCCTICRSVKTLDNFDKNVRCADGHFTQCKACRRAKRNASALRARSGASSVPYEDRPHISNETASERHFRMLKRALRWRDLDGSYNLSGHN